jgi:hypothetical protein
MTIESGAVFLHEIAPTLRRIGEHGGAHTVYYLIQLLERNPLKLEHIQRP